MIAALILGLTLAPVSTDIPEWKLKGEEKPIVEEYTEEYVEETTEAVIPESTSGSYLGTYELTAYCPTGNPTASGVYPTVGRTVACNSIPLGTTIYIEGYGTYVVEDTGGMGGGVIDIFVGSYDEAIQFGRQYGAQVYLAE